MDVVENREASLNELSLSRSIISLIFIHSDLSPASINRVGRILGDGKLPNLIALDMSC